MISIIIPTFNEEKNIERIQENLNNLKGDFEVIFSDGFSSDNTFSLIKESEKVKKIRESRFRSKQMNSAVKYAKGDILWFIHADSVLDKESIFDIEKSKKEYGCFRLEFDSKKILMKIVAKNSNRRVRYRNIAFGDQGIFIKKDLFLKIGMYKDIPIMEDYDLSIRLKAKKYKIFQLTTPIITSSRRFNENGIIKTIIKMQILQYRFRKHGDVQKIYTDYEK